MPAIKSKSLTISSGVRFPRNKPGLAQPVSIQGLQISDTLTIPLLNYQESVLTPDVSIGQSVRIGQMLADGIPATANGIVSDVAYKNIIHPTVRSCPCVVIQVDHTAEAQEDQPAHDPLLTLTLDRLHQCGVTGLGGAGFSTAEKLQSNSIHTLIVNAVECEPMISCDESLIICQPQEIITAVLVMIELTHCKRCVLAIENDKVHAIDALQTALSSYPHAITTKIELAIFTPIYPTGAERLLIKQITGIDIIYPARPVDSGIVCLNVATIHAGWRAQQGFALTSRIVTITGSKALNPCNVRVRFGTSVADVLRQTGNTHDSQVKVRAGGPLSGFNLQDIDVPVCATTNCITLEPAVDTREAEPCIRCGDCSDVCPVNLLPQQLYWYSNGKDLAGAQRFGLSSCIECGCCDVVCPSSIALTQTFRHTKSSVKEKRRQSVVATETLLRHKKREQRLLYQERAKVQQRQQAEDKLASGPDVIANALKRARNRKRQKKPDSGFQP